MPKCPSYVVWLGGPKQHWTSYLGFAGGLSISTRPYLGSSSATTTTTPPDSSSSATTTTKCSTTTTPTTTVEQQPSEQGLAEIRERAVAVGGDGDSTISSTTRTGPPQLVVSPDPQRLGAIGGTGVTELGGILSPLLTPLQAFARGVLIDIEELNHIRAILQKLSAERAVELKVVFLFDLVFGCFVSEWAFIYVQNKNCTLIKYIYDSNKHSIKTEIKITYSRNTPTVQSIDLSDFNFNFKIKI